MTTEKRKCRTVLNCVFQKQLPVTGLLGYRFRWPGWRSSETVGLRVVGGTFEFVPSDNKYLF